VLAQQWKAIYGMRVAIRAAGRMRNAGLISIVAIMVFGISTLSRAALQKGIQGSPHDFSAATWNTSRDTCSPCHQGGGHNRSGAPSLASWAHAASTAAFTLYDSPTFKAGRHSPRGASLACLSCHDGTVAINQLVSGLEGTEAVYVNPASQIGPDLHTSHPVSFTYDASLAAADGGLENPNTYRIGDSKSQLSASAPPVPDTWAGTSFLGKTLDEALLFNHKIECTSCHDVHQQQGSAPASQPLLRIDGTDRAGRGDLLCRTCHIK
jgi:hypothetical protein